MFCRILGKVSTFSPNPITGRQDGLRLRSWQWQAGRCACSRGLARQEGLLSPVPFSLNRQFLQSATIVTTWRIISAFQVPSLYSRTTTHPPFNAPSFLLVPQPPQPPPFPLSYPWPEPNPYHISPNSDTHHHRLSLDLALT